jgi:DNA-nicking Smr family endonuclease
MAGKDRRPSADEADLWRKVTGDVKPIPKSTADELPPGRDPLTPAAPAKAVSPRRKAKTPCRAAVEQPAPPPRRRATPELGHGDAPGVDRRTADKVRKGRMEIEARIDLHGMTQAEAHRALTAFIIGQHEAGRRCVLVVTGKGAWREGGGVLRDAVPRWLNQADLRPRLLSFTHAQRKDGGDGALYVLLKRIR